jgi:hypothetical protein
VSGSPTTSTSFGGAPSIPASRSAYDPKMYACSTPTMSAKPNTVQVEVLMVAVAGRVGCGQLAGRARLTCHLTYLRLISRGFDRDRRAGLSRWQSSLIARRQPCSG